MSTDPDGYTRLPVEVTVTVSDTDEPLPAQSRKFDEVHALDERVAMESMQGPRGVRQTTQQRMASDGSLVTRSASIAQTAPGNTIRISSCKQAGVSADAIQQRHTRTARGAGWEHKAMR